MLKIKIFTVLIALRSLVDPCHVEKKVSGFEGGRKEYKISRAGRLDPLISESSGLAHTGKDTTFYTHDDSGGKPELYEIDMSGCLIDVVKIPHASNKDWEDLARDDKGNIYIGDFGNNQNTRKNLRIYKVSISGNMKVDTISFSYPDQQEFPPPKKQRNFDCEAFFWYKDSLYLFSKNRGSKCVKFYKLPDQPGIYQAKLFHEVYLRSMITSADISPDKKEFVLLGYGKMYFFNNLEGESLKPAPAYCRKFGRGGQSEAVLFLNERELMVTNEGGKVFVVRKR